MIRLTKNITVYGTLILLALFLIHIFLERRLEDVRPTKHYDIRRDEEKFLTYLPHSGLHNQRIALINSIILAKALNRTLIMPELNLGTATYWRPSEHLPYRLDECGDKLWTTKHKNEDGTPWWSPNCFDYRNYLPMAVDSIFDLTAAQQQLGVKTIQRRDMKLNYFERYWGVPNDERNRTLVYQVWDHSRYSYQIVDDDDVSMNGSSKFMEQYTLQQLEQHQETFLIFNSLFGSDRLALRSAQWTRTRDFLRQEIGVRQPWVLNSSLDIIGRLGGQGAYMSVHIRMGDGIFRKMMDETMERVRQQLIQQDNLHEINQTTLDMIQSLASQPEQRLTACLQLQHQANLHSRLRLIYMTTDAPSPHQSLPHLFEEFVCLFTLDDFKDIVDATLALRPTLLDHQHQHHNNHSTKTPPTTKGDIFLPLIDAEVASQASFFVPTPKSTFSGYINYRNKRFRSMYTLSSSSL
ncbi:uncharacterized protein BX664DRAFT_329685 [Halteromyces radiatus]|uniref:uncharacterized protein n=1 Tax=Halteromyces radiatus TaxID=101107 RepID=UPI00221EC7DA|nr:uncharacterized protein BX664DRAFT_329685 [Halteromyces radiatus]KAI8093428.1 hypothetical protein BX664DRAFT_329685 [Halteromyces radiatus]